MSSDPLWARTVLGDTLALLVADGKLLGKRASGSESLVGQRGGSWELGWLPISADFRRSADDFPESDFALAACEGGREAQNAVADGLSIGGQGIGDRLWGVGERRRRTARGGGPRQLELSWTVLVARVDTPGWDMELGRAGALDRQKPGSPGTVFA